MNAVPKDLPTSPAPRPPPCPALPWPGTLPTAPAGPRLRPAGSLAAALLMLIAVYPLITAILYVLMPLTDGWALWQRTLLLAPVMIVSIVYGVTPFMQRRFAWFLLPRPQR